MKIIIERKLKTLVGFVILKPNPDSIDAKQSS